LAIQILHVNKFSREQNINIIIINIYFYLDVKSNIPQQQQSSSSSASNVSLTNPPSAIKENPTAIESNRLKFANRLAI